MVRDGRGDSRVVRLPARREPEEVTNLTMLRAVQQEGATIGTYPVEEAAVVGGRGHARRISNRGSSLTAAAQVLTGGRVDAIRKFRKRRDRAAERWQEESWALRNVIGELRFIGDRQARSVSQCKLYIGKSGPESTNEPERVTDGPAFEMSKMLFEDQAGVEQKLRRYAQHIIFTGESMILLRDSEARDGLDWTVHSSSELLGQSWVNYQLTDGVRPRKLDPENEIVVRSWTPDPKLSALADAPVRAVLPVLRELEALTKYVSAQIDSRLAGAGILLISDKVESLMKRPDDADEDYSFVDELVDYMIEPLSDRGAAGSVVPFVAKVPGDDPSKMMHHLTFAGELDPHMHERREEAIRRVALGMDSDPAVLLGIADANHWSAWSVDESEIKLGVAPIVTALCHTLTTTVIRPLLQAAGVPDADSYQAWFDTSALRLRPDRSTDAKELGDKLLISDERQRLEAGFDESDKPDDTEWKRRYIAELIKSDPANLGPILGKEIGIDWPEPEKPDVVVTPPPPGAPALPTADENRKPEDIPKGPPDTQEKQPDRDDPSERPQ